MEDSENLTVPSPALESASSAPPPAVLAAHDGSASFRVEALRRAFPEAPDPWDCNRLEVGLEGRAHGIAAALRGALLLNSELATLSAQLRKLGRGSSALESPFGEAAIEFSVRPLPSESERFRVELRLGELGCRTEADARFAFDADRSQLLEFADGLDRIVSGFPIRGSAEA
jgi:hypothetical protein